jgi:hypothetical protein
MVIPSRMTDEPSPLKRSFSVVYFHRRNSRSRGFPATTAKLVATQSKFVSASRRNQHASGVRFPDAISLNFSAAIRG